MQTSTSGKQFFKVDSDWPNSNFYFIENCSIKICDFEIWKCFLDFRVANECFMPIFKLPKQSILFVFSDFSIEEMSVGNSDAVGYLEDKFKQIISTNNGLRESLAGIEQMGFEDVQVQNN